MDEVSIHLPDKTGARRLRPRSTPRTDTTIESHRTRSVYRLTQEDDRVYAASGGDFSLEGYSLFKHGDERWARRFGHEIADFLMAAESDLFARVRSDEVLVASFPYKYVPTAAALMVDHTVTRLNHILSGENKPSVGYLHAFKYPWWPSGEHYFAHMEEKARRRILDNVELSIDKDRLRGAYLIIVDDIRVTGRPRTSFCSCSTRSRGYARSRSSSSATWTRGRQGRPGDRRQAQPTQGEDPRRRRSHRRDGRVPVEHKGSKVRPGAAGREGLRCVHPRLE